MNSQQAKVYLSRPKKPLEKVWIFFRYRIWGIIGGWRRSTRYAWQRAFRGYDDRMAYGYDTEFAELSIKALKRMLKYGNSYPGREEADTFEKWSVIVGQIIDGFQAYLEMDDYSLTDKDRAKAMDRFEKGMALYVKWYFNLWD